VRSSSEAKEGIYTLGECCILHACAFREGVRVIVRLWVRERRNRRVPTSNVCSSLKYAYNVTRTARREVLELWRGRRLGSLSPADSTVKHFNLDGAVHVSSRHVARTSAASLDVELLSLGRKRTSPDTAFAFGRDFHHSMSCRGVGLKAGALALNDVIQVHVPPRFQRA